MLNQFKMATTPTRRRNFFVSYHHWSNFSFLNTLRQTLQDKHLTDYGFKDQDLAESSKFSISRLIQYRIWSSSVTVVLVGSETGVSDWIDWEIWYSLRSMEAYGPARRVFKPKGLVALFLPTERHHVPERLQANLDSGYAVRLDWENVDREFYTSLEKAYENRRNLPLIRNGSKPRINPQGFFKRFFGLFFRNAQ